MRCCGRRENTILSNNHCRCPGCSRHFDDRLDRLLEERDYDFARSLLDSARNSEISDDRYHFERLRLFFAMDDAGGFQQYYDKIRPNLEDFDKDVVAGIEGLVTSIKQKS